MVTLNKLYKNHLKKQEKFIEGVLQQTTQSKEESEQPSNIETPQHPLSPKTEDSVPIQAHFDHPSNVAQADPEEEKALEPELEPAQISTDHHSPLVKPKIYQEISARGPSDQPEEPQDPFTHNHTEEKDEDFASPEPEPLPQMHPMELDTIKEQEAKYEQSKESKKEVKRPISSKTTKANRSYLNPTFSSTHKAPKKTSTK